MKRLILHTDAIHDLEALKKFVTTQGNTVSLEETKNVSIVCPDNMVRKLSSLIEEFGYWVYMIFPVD